MISALINIGFGILGMLLFSVFMSKKHIKQGWNVKDLWLKSKGYWAWSMIMLTLIVVILHFVPEASEPIKTLTGLDIGVTATSFITLGIGLTGISKG